MSFEISSLLEASFSAIADLLWPRCCCACDAPLGPLGCAFCPDCEQGLAPLLPSHACPRCAAPQGPGGCADCRRLRPLFARARAPFVYGGPLATALQRLKWRDRDDLAGPLGALLGPALLDCATRCDLLLPVPLHRQRLSARGYNQAGLLASAARRAARVPLPLRHGMLHRRGAAPPARGLGWAARRERSAGAFVVKGDLRNQRVLLIDDVLTTGATASGCAAALLAAGAARVEVLTLCRAVS